MGPRTIKRLAIVVVVLVLAVGSTFLIQRRQVARLGESNLSQAEQAVKQGDLKTAEELYLQHIQVFADDLESKLKYADVLIKQSRTPARLAQATRIYREVLDREPGRQDVRRLMAEAFVEQGMAREALGELAILQQGKPDDGGIEYLMGRSQQRLDDAAAAVASYKNALAHGVPEKYDAYREMATLLRGERLNQVEQADQVIEEMVKSDPKNFRGYLERGRYRYQFEKTPEALKKVVADYEEALKLAPKEASIYFELARVAAERTPPDLEEAARILRAGRDADPKEESLYRALANIELRGGKPEEAEKTFRQGIEILPDSLDLRKDLADILAQRGATTELREQIDQMKRIGVSSVLGDYYTAYYHINAKEWSVAKTILTEKLERLDLSSQPAFRAEVSSLLARCYEHLGDPERQRAALVSSMRDNPNSVQIRLKWAADLVAQGETEQAISEYRKLLPVIPQVRLPLAQLLIAQIQRLPAAQQNWKEVEDLIALAAKDAPTASQPVAAKAQLLLTQGKVSEALTLLQEARGRDVKDPNAAVLWTASAEILMKQGNFPAAQQLLDEAQAKLGDRFELRITRANLLAARGGPDVGTALIGLTENLNALPKEQQVMLLETIAGELSRRNDAAGAVRLWSQTAALIPNDLRPQLQLLNLGLQTNDKAVIEQSLKEVGRIEGPEGNTARYGDVEYWIWKAKTSKDPNEQTKLRAEARTKLAELSSRRPDWSMLPLATAKIEEQELELATDEADKKQRQSRLADLYRQAVDMGQRNLAIVRRGTEMLMASNRTAEVAQLWSKVPTLSGDGDLGLLERSVLDNVIRSKDYRNALEIIRQQVEARPNDFSVRILLVQLLLADKQPEEAEAELRKALAMDRSDPNRWVAMVQFLVSLNQIEKAEQSVKELQQAVAADRLPLIMAQCADMIGQGYQATAREAQKIKWYDEAKNWYQKAQAAKPGDVAMKRMTIEFLLRTNQLVEVENQLTDMLKRSAEFKSDDIEWAKRTLALSFVARSELQHDYQQALRALAILAPDGRPESKRSETPEDLRVLARVYEAQKIPAYRKKAIEVLEKLSDDRLASGEDRFLLARLYDANGEWEKARAEYRRLLDESKQVDTPQKRNLRIAQVVHYANQLIEHIRSSANQEEINEAQALVDELKKTQPDAFNVLSLQARLDKAQNKADGAIAKLKEIADRPGLSPALALATAYLAEDLGQDDLAQRLFKLNATSSSRIQDRLAYAAFLGRQGRIKDALDVCEPLWTAMPNPEILVSTVMNVLFASKVQPDAAEVERVNGWVERSIQQNPKSTLFLIAMGNIRERQKRYADAEALYRRAIAQERGDVVPLNNLAWLMALKGEKGTTALDLINRAIAMQGPIPEFLDTRAIVYLTNGESKRAIEDLENAVAISPSAVKYFHLAQAYLEASDKQAAKENLAKARTKGLAKGNLHPLELNVYEQVVSALD
jgi:cellulose synthase operon protein C